ncbi:MAG TPA: YggS family pyridoxal phosphate-dependent enzyme [Candidatus Polarisedimenticolia bacterium]|nr:YggS family pyridoxal phosphate-dependent enzyme [Candidatus Polarisedimenticolia bacterium]
MREGVAERLAAVRVRMARAAARSGRSPSAVTLVGVSKTMPAAVVKEAVAAGLADLGENRVQEAREKIPEVGPGPRWHLVGHLQANKANVAARLFDVVHSIDSADLLERLDRAAGLAGRRLRGYVQVALAGEEQKSGVSPGDLDGVLQTAERCGHVEVRGLMLLPPYDADPERSRPWFQRLREVADEARAGHPRLGLEDLSMGMSEDFEVAIEEGATHVRVGRAVFGARRQEA